jgi:hypothetical protein
LIDWYSCHSKLFTLLRAFPTGVLYVKYALKKPLVCVRETYNDAPTSPRKSAWQKNKMSVRTLLSIFTAINLDLLLEVDMASRAKSESSTPQIIFTAKI